MDESTADKIVQSLLGYRGESMIEDWTGTIVPIEVEDLKNMINEDENTGEIVGIPKLITALLSDNSQVRFVDGLNENVWDEDGDVEELTGVPEQMEWLASLDDIGPNDFSVVAFANDRDGIAPMVAWFVYKPNYGDVAWEKLGVLSTYWSMFEEHGVFSNRDSDGDFMYEDAESKGDDWWDRQLRSFIKALEEETGVIAFTVDFKGLPQFFVSVLNWKDWPEGLL